MIAGIVRIIEKSLQRIKDAAGKCGLLLGSLPLVSKLLVASPAILPGCCKRRSMSHISGHCLTLQLLVPPVGYRFKRQCFACHRAVIFDNHKVTDSILNHALGVCVIRNKRCLCIIQLNAAFCLVAGCPDWIHCQSHRKLCVCRFDCIHSAFHHQFGALVHIAVHADILSGTAVLIVAVGSFGILIAIQQDAVQFSLLYQRFQLVRNLVKHLCIDRILLHHRSILHCQPGKVVDSIERQALFMCIIVQGVQHIKGNQRTARLPQCSFTAVELNKDGVQTQISCILHHHSDFLGSLLLVNFADIRVVQRGQELPTWLHLSCLHLLWQLDSLRLCLHCLHLRRLLFLFLNRLLHSCLCRQLFLLLAGRCLPQDHHCKYGDQGNHCHDSRQRPDDRFLLALIFFCHGSCLPFLSCFLLCDIYKLQNILQIVNFLFDVIFDIGLRTKNRVIAEQRKALIIF